MTLLQKLGKQASYLKAGFLGFQGSGKTYTATLLACAAYRRFGCKGPMAFFDTETGSDYVAGLIESLTGEEPLRVKSQRFDDLMQVAREVDEANVPILLVDSMTHVWRELCESYLRNLNEARAKKGWGPRTNLEFQDWGPIKGKFSEWTRWFLSSRRHVIICGRAGYEYDIQNNDGRKELVKVGVKMKTEGEFGFEPSLLVEMEQEHALSENGPNAIHNIATVLKDRFNVIQGRRAVLGTGRTESLEECFQRTAAFFAPHIDLLNPKAHTPLATDPATRTPVDEQGADPRMVERDILLERIENSLTKVFPASTGRDKAMKLRALEMCLGTSSWTQISKRMRNNELAAGVQKLEALMAKVHEAVAEGLSPEEILPAKPESAAA